MEDDKVKISPHILTAIVSAAVVFVIILAIVLGMNKRPETVTVAQPESTDSTEEELPDVTYGTGHPEDLDFWDLYPSEKTPDTVPLEEVKEDPLGGEAPDPATDGKHTLVVLPDGSEEWVTINRYLPEHTYDYTNLVAQGDMMEYYIDGRKASTLGIDVSKYQDYIDFQAVKKAGIDFVMIRAGVRGYTTGQLSLDEMFLDNLDRASKAGLQIGLYFTSQALTAEEAEQEASLILSNIGEAVITYPIAIDMGYVDNDTARIEGLTRTEKTEVTKAFLDTIAKGGYTAMIKGNKEWLIKEIDLSKLTDYDIWLCQNQDLPDYPYQFSMWQYKLSGKVSGVTGYVSMDICFVDYTAK
ncbi:MAG: glycoside hydrolase family 25 protein [Lachnospiraceae bacterium]|nr:glycoside hydrolase family 25 protein [Lachnospiraceae bacterium]